LGNLDARRDWGYAGDYVKAMYLMLQQEKPDDFVVGTGENHSVREFVELAFKTVDISDWQKYVVIDPQFKPPAEVPDLKARADKAKKVLGWQPKVKFPELVKMMVEADLKRYQEK
jgi:GDPmannose 4,6-dehydratase